MMDNAEGVPSDLPVEADIEAEILMDCLRVNIDVLSRVNPNDQAACKNLIVDSLALVALVMERLLEQANPD